MFLPWNHFSTSHFLLETHCRAFNYTNLPMTGNEFTYKPFLFKLGKQGREFCWNNTFLLSHTILNLTQSLNLKAWQRERERDRVQSTGLWCWSPVQLYLNLSILRVYKVILSVGSSVVNNICEIDIHVTKWFLIKEQRNNMKFFISVKLLCMLKIYLQAITDLQPQQLHSVIHFWTQIHLWMDHLLS
jgi:hypothetical protein